MHKRDRQKRDKQKRAAIYTKMRAPYLVENTHRDFVLVGRVARDACGARRLWRMTHLVRVCTYAVYFLRFMCFADERFRPARPAPSIPAEPSKDAST